MEKLILITGNEGKAREYREILGDIISIKDIDLLEIQEINPDVILEHKVKQAYEELHVPVLVEDVSLSFNAISPLPGTLIKWFIKSIGSDGLVRILKDYQDKSAELICSIGMYDGKQFHAFKGIVNGMIANSPIGENGFGFDNIFIPDGYDKTYAQMENDEKNAISHRGLAIKELLKFLQSS